MREVCQNTPGISNAKMRSVRFNRIMWGTLSVIIFVFLIGCGSDDEKDQVLSIDEQISQGWDSFEDRDFASALASFESALAQNQNHVDALNGAGWSAGRIMGKLTEADAHFNKCLQQDPNKYDALGGSAFVTFQKSELDADLLTLAVDKALSLMNSKPRWRFLHEQSVNYLDIHLMTVQAYYNMGELNVAYRIIREYFNSTFETDVSSPSGQRELLEEIERLRQIHG